MTIHGALVSVRGVGVLLLGSSGAGKSECALELISRGHRLVADDVVELHVSESGALLGRSPERIRHHLEIRGLGILYVPDLYGPDRVLDETGVDLVCRIERWRALDPGHHGRGVRAGTIPDGDGTNRGKLSTSSPGCLSAIPTTRWHWPSTLATCGHSSGPTRRFRALRKAIEQGAPGQATPHMNLARMMAALGQMDEAVKRRSRRAGWIRTLRDVWELLVNATRAAGATG